MCTQTPHTYSHTLPKVFTLTLKKLKHIQKKAQDLLVAEKTSPGKQKVQTTYPIKWQNLEAKRLGLFYDSSLLFFVWDHVGGSWRTCFISS